MIMHCLTEVKTINDAKLMQKSDAKIENTLYVSSQFFSILFSNFLFLFYLSHAEILSTDSLFRHSYSVKK